MTAALLLARAHWKLIGIGLCSLAMVMLFVRGNHYRNQRDEARIERNECREGRKQDRLAYEQAQRDAKAKNEAEVARIKAEQEKINAETKSRYGRDLRRLRAGGLRKDIAAPKSDACSAEASADGTAAAGADGSTSMCVLTEDLLRGAEVELRLLHLQNWIREQLQIAR